MIVNNENTIEQAQGADLNQELTSQESVNGVNQGNGTTDPDPPIKAEKVYEYFKSVLDANNKPYKEATLRAYSQLPDVKSYIRKFYTYNGLADQMPTQEEADSIYNTWIDKPVVEKKNLDQTLSQQFSESPNVQEDSDSPSTSENTISLSESPTITLTEDELKEAGYVNTQEIAEYDFDSWKNEIDIKGVGGYLDEKKYLEDVVNSIPKDFFTSSERDAKKSLEAILRPYGFSVSETEALKDVITIQGPQGQKMDVRLFTDNVIGYQNQLKLSGQTNEEVESLLNRRFDEFKQFIVNSGSPVDNMASIFTKSQNLVLDISNQSFNALTPRQEQLVMVAQASGLSTNDFFDDGVFNPYKLERVIGQIKTALKSQKLNADKSQFFRDGTSKKRDALAIATPAQDMSKIFGQDKQEITRGEIVQKTVKELDAILNTLKSKRETSSKLIGSAMAMSGSYKNVDLRNAELLTNISQAGLKMSDMPLDGILINGVPSTMNTLEDILTNPTGRNDVIRGNIKIEIGNPDDYGLLADYIRGAQALIDRNEATPTKTKGGAEGKIFYEWGEDFIQGLGLSTMEILANTGVALSESMQSVGVPEWVADGIVHGTYGLPIASGLPRPEEIMKLKESALPLYDVSISDAGSFGDMLALANQPMANSIPYYAAFAINPAFGLTVTGTSTFGATITEIDQLKDAAQQNLEDGVELTETQKNILNISDQKARGIALTQSISEVAITRLFTYNFFKATRAARNFKGAKNVKSARELASQYGKRMNVSVRTKIARALGIDASVLKREIPEEEFVALSNYFINVQFGIDEWDDDRAAKLMKDTGLTSLFSSSTMSKIGRYRQNSNIRKVSDQVIKNNLNIAGEGVLHRTKLLLDTEIKGLEQSGLDGANDPQLKAALQLKAQVNNQILLNEKRKDQLLKSMTPADKAFFLETITKYEEAGKAIDNSFIDEVVYNQPTRNDIRENAYKNMEKYQEALRQMLTKYPSELSYNFITQDAKLKYDDRASKELQDEAEARGEKDFEITTEQIEERASQIYLQDLKDKKTTDQEQFVPAAGYTAFDPSILFVDVDEQDFENFVLSDAIKRSKSKREAQPVQGTIDFEQDTQNYLGLSEVISEESISRFKFASEDDPYYSVFTNAIERAKNELKKYDDQDSKTLLDLISDKRFIENIRTKSESEGGLNDYMELFYSYANSVRRRLADDSTQPTQQVGESLNVERVNDIITRIEAFNGKADLMSMLPKEQAKHIVRFFDDLDKGKNPMFGHVEAIMNAQEIATQIKSKTPEQIDIFATSGLSYQSLNALAQKLVTAKAGFGTGDILLKTLFRDSEKGSEFYDLYREMVRKVNVAEGDTNRLYDEALKKYKSNVKAYNKSTAISGKKYSDNANEVENSYELYMLAGALRKSGVTNKDGVDLEFARWKSLVTQELELRRADFEKAEGVSKEKFRQRLLYWEEAYNNLGFKDAKSFDDIASGAQSFNVDFINELAAMQPGKDALQRITDFGGSIENKERGTQQPFVDGTYVPVPLTKKAGHEERTVAKQAMDDAMSFFQPPAITDASNLNEISFVESLGADGVRLNPGMFAKNAFTQMRGAKMDIDARKDMVTLQYLLENETFKSLFKNKKDYDVIASYFQGQNKIFNDVVNGNSEVYVDIGSDDYKTTLQKFSNAAYSQISAVSLARVSQRSTQFVSAVAGTSPYIKSDAAKRHLNKGSRYYAIGLSGALNGAKSRHKVGAFFQNSLIGTGDLSNIYNKSRTGMRNSLKAEFALGDNTEVPSQYILDALKIKDEDGKIIQALGAKTTINSVLDFVSKGSELSLDLFLGSTDQAAANLAFESHYIQERERQGVNFDDVKSMKDWWAKENENPNIEAINKADAMVAQTMRQTGKLGEAGIYQDTAGKQTLVRMLFPFQKFVSNARANFANQYAIINDPTIPESQKKEARAAMQGIVQEVASFQAIKLGFAMAQLKGFAPGIFGFGLEEEDIKREGGYSQLIGSDILPIEDRPGVFEDLIGLDEEYQDLMNEKLPISQKRTKEAEFIAAKMNVKGVSLEKAALFIDKYAREYENKFQAGKTYGIVVPTMQDVFTTTSLVPFTEGLDDALFHNLNQFLDEDVFTEFVSKDLQKADTKEGRRNLIIEAVGGLYGIGEEQVNKIVEAIDMKAQHVQKISAGEYGTQEQFIGGGKSVSRNEQLKQSVDILLALRLSSVLIPGAPKGDFNKLANYLERALQKEFTVGAKPDPMMTENQE